MKTTKTPRNSLCRRHTIRKLLAMISVVSLSLASMVSPVHALRLQDSDVYKGFMNMLQDIFLIATAAAPVIGAIAAVIYLIRRGMADEQDKKQWNKRIFDAILTGIGAGLISGLIAVLVSYFNPTTP